MNGKRKALLIGLIVASAACLLLWRSTPLDYATALSVSADKGFAAVGSSGGNILLLKLPENSLEWEFSTGDHSITSIRFTADGETIYAATQEGLIIAMSREQGVVSHRRQIRGTIADVLLTPDWHIAIAGFFEQTSSTLVSCDIEKQLKINAFPTTSIVKWLHPGPDDGQIISIADDGVVTYWEGKAIRSQTQLVFESDKLILFDLDSAGRFAAGMDAGGILSCWSMESGNTVWTSKRPGLTATACAISTDGELFAFGFANGQITVYDTNDGQLVIESRELGRPISTIQFVSENEIIATCGYRRFLKPGNFKLDVSSGTVVFFEK
jgi:WD40 repeat protein